jgi:hypothetical protein
VMPTITLVPMDEAKNDRAFGSTTEEVYGRRWTCAATFRVIAIEGQRSGGRSGRYHRCDTVNQNHTAGREATS